MPVEPGLCGHVELLVTGNDTAPAANCGDVEVLSTPRIIALCEQAAVEALRALLDEGETTVGKRVQLDHLAPVAVGGSVTVDARLEKIQGRRLTFSVSVHDDRGLVAAGKVMRVIVDRERFLEQSR